MEWQRRQKSRCPGCGFRPDEGTDFWPDHETCEVCARGEQYMDAVTDEGKTRKPRGMRMFYLPAEQYQAREEARAARQAASDARWAALAAQEHEDGS